MIELRLEFILFVSLLGDFFIVLGVDFESILGVLGEGFRIFSIYVLGFLIDFYL